MAPARRQAAQQPVGAALKEALRHRSYVLLVIGYFTCGFQLFFITVHLPAYLVDRGLPPRSAPGPSRSSACSTSSARWGPARSATAMPKRTCSYHLLRRALAMLVFISLPASAVVALMFGAVIGLWLSSVPPTTGLIRRHVRPRGSPCCWASPFQPPTWRIPRRVARRRRVQRDRLLRRDLVAVDPARALSAVINLPIEEKPVAREAAAAA